MNNQEPIANRSWDNEGICLHFAEENIEHKYIAMYLFFVRRSFGYSKRYTNRISIKEIVKITKLSEPTVISYIRYLTSNGFIKVNKSTKFIKDGGSEAYSYSPCYPKGYGKLKFKDDLDSGSKVESKPALVTKEPEIVESEFTYVKGKDYDF